MNKIEYDLQTWTNFPSSLKFTSEGQPLPLRTPLFPNIAVTPNTTLTFKMDVKQENIVTDFQSQLAIYRGPIPEAPWITGWYFPKGTYDWTPFVMSLKVPDNVTAINGILWSGGGTPEKIGCTWFDNLKIYQDGVLIYSNDFSNWNPYIGAGVGVMAGIPAYLITKKLIITIGVIALGTVIGTFIGYATAKP